MAIVKETNDEDQLGRVKVQLTMDENEVLTPWLRVLTSYTSQGGSLWLPEKGEQVVIFFEDFNPENAPFVVGGFYTGTNKADAWEAHERGFTVSYTHLTLPTICSV